MRETVLNIMGQPTCSSEMVTTPTFEVCPNTPCKIDPNTQVWTCVGFFAKVTGSFANGMGAFQRLIPTVCVEKREFTDIHLH